MYTIFRLLHSTAGCEPLQRRATYTSTDPGTCIGKLYKEVIVKVYKSYHEGYLQRQIIIKILEWRPRNGKCSLGHLLDRYLDLDQLQIITQRYLVVK